MPLKSQGKCYPRVLFEQYNQPQNPRQDLGRFLPENRGNQPRQREQYPIPKQECPSQRIRDPVEMDAQIAHTLQAEEQAKEQCQSFQRDRQVSQLAEIPHRQNIQHLKMGYIRSTRYSGHNLAERDLEYNQTGRQTTRDIYPQEAQRILQRVE